MLRCTLPALLLYLPSLAQYAPAAGLPGSTAVSKDDPSIVSWATACHVVRGRQDISDPQSPLASAGDSSMATGKAMDNGVVSLGDGGYAVCNFRLPISDGPGADFAVFENSFSDTYLELAFVEVSSDGVNYFRFPSHSLTDTAQQKGSFDTLDCRKLNNLAGKYRGGYGTPFDLSELGNKPGLDIASVTHVRIVDVVGSMNKSFATRDSYGNKVNDPWPTAFPSSGFDLDAVGVIHETTVIGLPERPAPHFRCYPNPAPRGTHITLPGGTPCSIFQTGGRLVGVFSESVDTESFSPGLYIIQTREGAFRLLIE